MAENYVRWLRYNVDEEGARLGIIEGLARSLWALQWLAYEKGNGRCYPEAQLEEIAPDTPEEAFEAAADLIGAIEYRALVLRTTVCQPVRIARLYVQARESKVDTPQRFGEALARLHQRTGWRWGDDHEQELWFEVPDVEVDLEEQAAEAGPVEVKRGASMGGL